MNRIESKHFLYLGLAILLVIVLALFLGQRLTNISLGPLDVGFADNVVPTNTPAPPTEPPIDQDDPGAPTITATPEETLDNGRSTATTDAPTPAPTVEEGVRNPTGPVPAGTPVLDGDLALEVDSDFELLQAGGSKPAAQVAVRITVENRGHQSRLFTFTRAGITLNDDLGNTYAYASGKRSELSAAQQVQIPSGDMLEWVGALTFDPADPVSLPAFEGPVKTGASQLTLSFEEFGPYDGLEIFIDL